LSRKDRIWWSWEGKEVKKEKSEFVEGVSLLSTMLLKEGLQASTTLIE